MVLHFFYKIISFHFFVKETKCKNEVKNALRVKQRLNQESLSRIVICLVMSFLLKIPKSYIKNFLHWILIVSDVKSYIGFSNGSKQFPMFGIGIVNDVDNFSDSNSF